MHECVVDATWDVQHDHYHGGEVNTYLLKVFLCLFNQFINC